MSDYGHALAVLRRLDEAAKDADELRSYLARSSSLSKPVAPALVERGWITAEGEVTEEGQKLLARDRAGKGPSGSTPLKPIPSPSRPSKGNRA